MKTNKANVMIVGPGKGSPMAMNLVVVVVVVVVVVEFAVVIRFSKH